MTNAHFCQPLAHSFLPFSNLSRNAFLCRRTCSGSGVDCRTAPSSILRPGPASAGTMTGIMPPGRNAVAAAALRVAADVVCVGLGVATVCSCPPRLDLAEAAAAPDMACAGLCVLVGEVVAPAVDGGDIAAAVVPG